MSDEKTTDENTPPAEVSLSPASPAEGPTTPTLGCTSDPTAPAYQPSVDDPDLLAAATGVKHTTKRKTNANSTSFKPGTPYHRPWVMTKETVRQVLVGIRTKYTVVGAAAFAGIGTRTFHRWKKENADFAELVELARSHRLEELLDELMRQSQLSKKEGGDWRGIAWVLERLPWVHRELYKRDPNAVTPEILAAKIGEIVTRILPLVEADKQAEAQRVMEEICGTLVVKDDESDDGV